MTLQVPEEMMAYALAAGISEEEVLAAAAAIDATPPTHLPFVSVNGEGAGPGQIRIAREYDREAQESLGRPGYSVLKFEFKFGDDFVSLATYVNREELTHALSDEVPSVPAPEASPLS